MMSAPSPVWSAAPKVSRLWSARGDERCSPPRSDDYKDWSLAQLKREITQRQLKTNPRRRNKDAFVRVLLAYDQEQALPTQTQNAPHNQQQPMEESVMFVPSSTSELQNIYVNNSADQQEMYANNGTQQEMYIDHQPQPQQQPEINDNSGQQQFIPSDVNAGVMQSATLTPPPAQVQTPVVQTPEPEAAVADAVASEVEVNTPTRFQASKRQRVEAMRDGQEGGGIGNLAARGGVTATGNYTQQVTKGSTEYLRRKLGIQAARLEIESRRLDLETKREQRDIELHVVQLALAQEQLQQAKMATQKMKTEWMVEQMMQKKRLDGAGISQEDSATLGMYLS